MNQKEQSKTKDPKVIDMMPKLTEQEQEIMDKAAIIQKEKQEEMMKKQNEIVAILTEKYGLTKEAINQAIDVEMTLSKPETGIETVLEAMDFYVKSGLSANQIMFLAITANSRANALNIKVNEFKRQLDSVLSQLNTIEIEKEVEREAKKEFIENLPTDDIAELSNEENPKKIEE